MKQVSQKNTHAHYILLYIYIYIMYIYIYTHGYLLEDRFLGYPGIASHDSFFWTMITI